MIKTTYAKVRSVFQFVPTAKATAIKYVQGQRNNLSLTQSHVFAFATRYRKLGDMDDNEGVMLNLHEFDQMTLEDLDYIEI